jgi:hypothetical protein
MKLIEETPIYAQQVLKSVYSYENMKYNENGSDS